MHIHESVVARVSVYICHASPRHAMPFYACIITGVCMYVYSGMSSSYFFFGCMGGEHGHQQKRKSKKKRYNSNINLDSSTFFASKIHIVATNRGRWNLLIELIK